MYITITCFSSYLRITYMLPAHHFFQAIKFLQVKTFQDTDEQHFLTGLVRLLRTEKNDDILSFIEVNVQLLLSIVGQNRKTQLMHNVGLIYTNTNDKCVSKLVNYMLYNKGDL